MILSAPILVLRESQIDEYLVELASQTVRPGSVILFTLTARKVNEILQYEKLSVMYFHELRVKKGDIGILFDLLKNETTQEDRSKLQLGTVVINLSDLMDWIDSFEFCKISTDTLQHLQKTVLGIDMKGLSEEQKSKAPNYITILKKSLKFNIQGWGESSDFIDDIVENGVPEEESIIQDFQTSTRDAVNTLQATKEIRNLCN